MNIALRFVVVLALVASGACTDLDIIPADAQLVCASDEDCPDGFSCRLAIGRCLDSARAQAAPIAVVTPAVVAQARRSQQPGFSIVEASASFSTTPVSVGGLLDDSVPLACSIDSDHVVRCELDLAAVDNLVAGEHDVSLFADDGLGTIASSRARFTLDLEAPDVVDDAVVVTYLPDEDNALDVTAAVGAGSDATVQLSLTETLGVPPEAVINGAASGLRFEPALPTGLVASLLIDGEALAASDGPVDVTITLADDVGNARTVVLQAVLQVDHTAPAPAAVNTTDAVVYARVPDGSSATSGVPQFTLTITAGVEANATVVVTTAADFESTPLGEAVADDTGSAIVDLAPVDLASVFVHVIDAAGNISAAARVRDIVWTASLGGRVVGDPRSNPHALFASTDFDGVSLTPHLRDEVTTANELAIGGAVDVVARGAFVQDPVLSANPPTTARVSLVWHAARGELLAFGGIDVSGFSFTSRLLRLDGERWEEVVTQGVQPPAADGVAVYDPIGERLVLVQSDGQTWFLEGTSWRAFNGAAPTAASGASVAFDEARRGIVRFGGRLPNSTARHNETWFFDGDSWRLLAEPGAPSPRSDAAMSFDRVDNGLVLRGGRDDTGAVLGDLWRLDGSGWHQLLSGELAGYADGAAVTDPVSGRVQFVGGTFGEQTLSEVLQTFDGTQLVSRSSTLTRARNSGAAWDLAQQRLVVLGGSAFNLGPNLLTHFIIIEDDVARRPGGRTPLGQADNARVTCDRATGNIVLFGGSFAVGAGAAALTSTRLWNGLTASTVDVLDTDPSFPTTDLFFDGAHVGSFGGSDVLQLDADGWTTVTAVPPEVPSFSVGFAFHAGRNVAFGFGGSSTTQDAMDTTVTVRDGVVRVLTPSTSPPARRSAQLAYDGRHDRVVLYGGTTSQALLRDTWVFEGETWRALDTVSADVGEARLLYDEARGVVVRLADGSGTSALLVDELRDDRWVRRDVRVPGAARRDFNATWDVQRGHAFIQGGFSDGRSTADLFTWDGDAHATPAVLLAVDLRARETRTTTVSELEITATAGATGADLDGVAIDGIEVLAWGDVWERVGDGAAGANAAERVIVRIDDEAQLARVIKDRLVVAVRAAAPSGGGPPAALHIEELEVTVRYRED